MPLDLLKQKKPLDVETLNKIQLDASTMVELRFEELKYDIIDLLRTDPLVDKQLTPQGAGSIRIVLGVFGEFPK